MKWLRDLARIMRDDKWRAKVSQSLQLPLYWQISIAYHYNADMIINVSLVLCESR